MSTKIVILGAAGRMGLAITRCLQEGAVEGLELTGAVDWAECPDLGRDIGELAGGNAIGVPLTNDVSAAAQEADVLIDFSFHTATAEHARKAADWGKAFVVGTTGLAEDERATVEEAASRIPVVMAPTMSVGVNLLFSLARKTAEALKGKGYDAEIIEKHHRRKKDAPSGTALGLGEAVAEGFGLDLHNVVAHGRSGMAPGERPREEIGIHAVRGGDIVGDHSVVFATDGEIVELSHRATSRDAFAVGALRAAAWLAGQKAGLYTMHDVLEL